MTKTNGYEEQLTLLQNEGLKIEKWLKEANVADECIGSTYNEEEYKNVFCVEVWLDN